MRRVLLSAAAAGAVLLSGRPANAGIYPTIPAPNPVLWELYHHGADQFMQDGRSAQNESARVSELTYMGMYDWADADLWHAAESDLPATGAAEPSDRSLAGTLSLAAGSPVEYGKSSLGTFGSHGHGHANLGLHNGWNKQGSGFGFGHNSEHHFSGGSNYNVHTGGGTTPTEPVPEPATLALLVLGLAGLGYYKRRQLGW